jgi:hypothetical protein
MSEEISLKTVERVRPPSDPSEGIIFRYGVVLGFIGLIISQIMGVPNQYALIIFTAIIVSVVVIATTFLIIVNLAASSRPLKELLSRHVELLSRHMPSDEGLSRKIPSNEGREPVSMMLSLIEGGRAQSRTVGFSVSLTCRNCGNTIANPIE